MPVYGQPTHGVRRYGGAIPRVVAILASLNRQMGTAFDVSTSSPRYYMNLALAKALGGVWDAAEKFGNQFDWRRVTTFLSRWERIFGIYPAPGMTQKERRDALGARWVNFGRVPAYQAVIDALTPYMGDISLSIVEHDNSDSYDRWPYGASPVHNLDAGPVVTIQGTPQTSGYQYIRWEVDFAGALGAATFKWWLNYELQATGVLTAANVALGTTGLHLQFNAGAYALGARYFAEVHAEDFSAGVCYIAILVPKPSTMSETEYAARMAGAKRAMECEAPAWLEYSFVRDSDTLGAGFWLDQTRNLDNMRFTGDGTSVHFAPTSYATGFYLDLGILDLNQFNA